MVTQSTAFLSINPNLPIFALSGSMKFRDCICQENPKEQALQSFPPKPNNHTLRLLVFLPHEGDLVVRLPDTLLLDAECINPQQSWPISRLLSSLLAQEVP
jgi:hypothetical protein